MALKLNFMTYDPNVLNALYFSLDGRLFKLRADRCLFFLARYLFLFYACSISLRKLLGLVPSSMLCLGVIVSYTYNGTLS